MGKAKSNVPKIHELTEMEYNLLKLTNTALQFNVAKNNIVSGLCYVIAMNRLGYTTDKNLQFEVDFESDERKIIVSVLAD